jgi:hypothetical protein
MSEASPSKPHLLAASFFLFAAASVVPTYQLTPPVSQSAAKVP